MKEYRVKETKHIQNCLAKAVRWFVGIELYGQ